MKEAFSRDKNMIIIGAIVLAIVVGAYFFINRDQGSSDALLSVSATSSAPIDSELLTALGQLKRIKLDTTVFTNPVWLSLADFGQTLSPQAAGRPNPFAPLGIVGTSTATISAKP